MDKGILPTFPSIFLPLSSRAPEPPWLQLGLPIIFITSFLIPHKYRLGLVPIVLVYLSQIPGYASQNPMETYSLGMSTGCACWNWAGAVFGGEAEKRFWWIEDEQKAGNASVKQEGSEGLSPTEIEESKKSRVRWLCWKLMWATSLMFGPRGVGWNWQVKNIPEGVSKEYPRSRFVAKSLFKATYSFIIFDLTSIYIRTRLPKILPSTEPAEVFRLPITSQVFWSFITVLQVMYALKFGYALLAAIFVAIHLSSPSSWPPLMQSFSSYGSTVRSMWSNDYHQMLRRTTSTLPISLCKQLSLRKGGVPSMLIQLFLGFAISSLLHYIGALNEACPAMIQLQAWMFFVQPLAILFESSVIGLGRRVGIEESAWMRLLGKIWAFGWMSYSMRFVFASSVAAGFHKPNHPSTVLEPWVGRYLA